jgi:hypothetical protein
MILICYKCGRIEQEPYERGDACYEACGGIFIEATSGEAYNRALDDAKGAVNGYRKSRSGYPNEAIAIRVVFQNAIAAIEGLRRKG